MAARQPPGPRWGYRRSFHPTVPRDATGPPRKAARRQVLASDDGCVVGLLHNSGVRNGKRFDVDCGIEFQVRNGRIVSGREYFFDLHAWDAFLAYRPRFLHTPTPLFRQPDFEGGIAMARSSIGVGVIADQSSPLSFMGIANANVARIADNRVSPRQSCRARRP